MTTAHAHPTRLQSESIRVPADPNGVVCGGHDDALYVSDAKSGAILRLAGGAHRRIAQIDSGGVIGSSRVGGLAITPDGTLYVTRLGYGRAGGVFRVAPDGRTEALAGLAVEPWRVGLAYDAAAHALYVAQYRKALAGPFDGAIIKIDLASGASTTVVTDLIKPVGVVVLGDSLVITDPRARTVYRVDLAGGREVSRTALATDIDRPDSCVAAGPDSVLVTTYDAEARVGAVRELGMDGRARTLAVGDWEPRGIATDGDRVYVSARRGERILVFAR